LTEEEIGVVEGSGEKIKNRFVVIFIYRNKE
jgi:hypothetical protein